MIKLSIVTSLYMSEDTVEEFVQMYSQACEKLVGDSFEVILVNDESPDQTRAVVRSLLHKFPNLVFVDLSRNFGQHKAIFEGMKHASGEFCYICDSDLEEPADWLFSYWKILQGDSDIDLVGGVLEKRDRGIRDNIFGSLAWRLVNAVNGSRSKSVQDVVTARLFRRPILDAMNMHDEGDLFMATLFEYAGFNQHFVSLKKPKITETSYSFRRKISLLVHGLFSHPQFAPKVSIWVASAYTLFPMLMLVYLLSSLSAGEEVPGWLSQMVFVSVSMLVLFFLQILHGIMLCKILQEVRGRPRVIVKSIEKSKE